MNIVKSDDNVYNLDYIISHAQESRTKIFEGFMDVFLSNDDRAEQLIEYGILKNDYFINWYFETNFEDKYKLLPRIIDEGLLTKYNRIDIIEYANHLSGDDYKKVIDAIFSEFRLDFIENRSAVIKVDYIKLVESFERKLPKSFFNLLSSPLFLKNLKYDTKIKELVNTTQKSEFNYNSLYTAIKDLDDKQLKDFDTLTYIIRNLKNLPSEVTTAILELKNAQNYVKFLDEDTIVNYLKEYRNTLTTNDSDNLVTIIKDHQKTFVSWLKYKHKEYKHKIMFILSEKGFAFTYSDTSLYKMLHDYYLSVGKIVPSDVKLNPQIFTSVLANSIYDWDKYFGDLENITKIFEVLAENGCKIELDIKHSAAIYDVIKSHRRGLYDFIDNVSKVFYPNESNYEKYTKKIGVRKVFYLYLMHKDLFPKLMYCDDVCVSEMQKKDFYELNYSRILKRAYKRYLKSH